MEINQFERRLSEAGIKIEKKGEGAKIDDEPSRFYQLPPDQLETAWKLARETVSDGWPIILPKQFYDKDISTTDPKLVKRLASFEKVKVKPWFEAKWQDYLNCDGFEERLIKIAAKDRKSLAKTPPDSRFGLAEFIVKFQSHIGPPRLVLMPKIESYLIPIYYGFGGVNSIPRHYQLAAILKYWHEKYGAELAGLSFDTMELFIKDPPKGFDEELAKELFVFADEIHSPHEKSIGKLAAALNNVNVWRCWWD